MDRYRVNLKCAACGWRGSRIAWPCGKDGCTPENVKHEGCTSDARYIQCPHWWKHEQAPAMAALMAGSATTETVAAYVAEARENLTVVSTKPLEEVSHG